MDDEELTAAFAELRTISTNIIGFHIEADRESNELTHAERAMYEAQVYAGGVALAWRVFRIADELDRRQQP